MFDCNHSIPFDLTSREIALGGMMRCGLSCGAVQPGMRDGESVELTYSCRDEEGDAEFVINHDPSRRVKFGQLSAVFIRPDAVAAYSGTVMVHGAAHVMAGMDSGEFRRLTEGRRFTVSCVGDMYSVNMIHPAAMSRSRIGEVCDYIREALDAGRYEDVVGLALPAVCYSLWEERQS